MKTIEIIKHCLDAYKKAVEEAPKNYYRDWIVSTKFSLGICWYLDNTDINCNERYWIHRHCMNKRLYWCSEAYYGLQYLQKRVEILQKEYDHHKKWGFLAKYIKP
jgi:hypothetical protein